MIVYVQAALSVVGLLAIGFLLGRFVEERRKPRIGQLWDSIGGHDRTRGLHVVIARNDSRESPDSWVMRRLHDGKISYMHRRARERREWLRVMPGHVPAHECTIQEVR